MTAQRTAIIFGGKTGLLGQKLARTMQQASWKVYAPGREDVDIFNIDSLAAYIERYAPDFICNAIAYTAVDAAEDHIEEARNVNAVFPALLGQVLAGSSTRLLHISTDFVFDGKSTTPYPVDAPVNPQSVYGATKLEGEQALVSALPEKQLMVGRTAWLFGPDGRNFVQTIVNLCKEREALSIVHDQVGSPTYTPDLARWCLALAESDAYGTFHLVNSGQASWCELATEAVTLAEAGCTITAISSSGYPQKAVRPAYSVLDTSRFTNTTGITPRPWVQALREYVFQHLLKA